MQHKKITLKRVEDILNRLQNGEKEELQDLLRLLVVIDTFVVKHDRTDMARRLRAAFDKLEESI